MHFILLSACGGGSADSNANSDSTTNQSSTSNSTSSSITNNSLQAIAEDEGMEIDVRPVLVEELADFDEVGACGTAAVISPISTIIDRDTTHGYHFCKEGKVGPISEMLYSKLRDIQEGEAPDKFGWITFVE